MSEDINLEVVDGALGLLPAGADDVHAVIGTCSLGTAGSIFATRDLDALISARGYGPGIQGAAVALKRTGKTVLFCKADSTTPGSINEADEATVAITSSTAATPAAVATTTPHGYVTGDVITIAAHLVNTALVGTHIITKTGASGFTANGVVGNGVGAGTGTCQFTGVNVGESSGTSVPTFSGVPVDNFALRWKWVVGGTRGTAGATFKYSLDGGLSYSATQPIGTAVEFEIPNTGLTIEFSAGTFAAADEYRLRTTGPAWGASAVEDCIDALAAQVAKFRLINLVGDLSAADAGTFDTALENLTAAYRYIGLLGHARDADFAAGETEEDWADDVADDFSAFSSTRVSVTGGHYPTSSPVDGHSYRRPLSFAACARLMDRPIHEHAGRVRSGPLKGVSIPSDSATVSLDLEALTYHDSRKNPTLKTGRFFTARTRIGRPGLFADTPAMMAGPTSDFQMWPHRCVVDKACDLAYEVLVDVLNDDLQLDPVTGFILDKEAKAIESRLRSAYRDGLLATRSASAVVATVSRTDNLITTKTLTVRIRVTPKGYVTGIDVTVGFTNPSLELG